MTIGGKTFEYRAKSGKATIIVRQYAEKPHFVWFWEILVQYDNSPVAIRISNMLIHKPRKQRIEQLIDEY
jgi:hypothetical protein